MNLSHKIAGPILNQDTINILNEETENGFLLQKIRQYQIEYGNGSWTENILIPYYENNQIKNLVIVNNPEDAERLANKHIKKMSNLKPFVFDSIISTTDVSHWKDQRSDFQSAFSIFDKLEKIMPISSRRSLECVDTLWNLSK